MPKPKKRAPRKEKPMTVATLKRPNLSDPYQVRLTPKIEAKLLKDSIKYEKTISAVIRDILEDHYLK
jgi:hypothetical protein